MGGRGFKSRSGQIFFQTFIQLKKKKKKKKKNIYIYIYIYIYMYILLLLLLLHYLTVKRVNERVFRESI